MTDWLTKYRDSVNWGDDIRSATAFSRDGLIREIQCCFFPVKDSYFYVVPGTIKILSQAIADAAVVKANSNSSTYVLFTDEQATEAQVEESMYVLAKHGFGCRFLEPQPDVLHLGLLVRMSEGTIVEEAIELLQEGSNG